MADFFDDLEQSGGAPKKPFFEIDLENDSEIMTWFKEEISFLRQNNQFRFQKIKNNYARYKGIQYRDQVYQPRDLPQKRIRYMPQMVVPLISDAVDEKTARLLEYRPSVVVIPKDDEMQDKADAKVAKRFLSHVDQMEKGDDKFFKYVRSSKIAGESFFFILWDPDKGELIHEGLPITLPNGRTIQNPVYQGDVCWANYSALNVLYEKAESWETTNYIFRFDWEYTDALKRDFPDKASEIKTTDVTQYYDFEKMEDVSLRGKTMVVNFYHKKNKYLPEGYEAKFCNDVLLKKGPLSYKDGKLPCVRLTDIDNEDEQSGESFLEKVRAMASQYNNINNTIIKQQMEMSHPKWAIDAGSVDEQSLNNDTGLLKLKPGSREPKLIQANPVSPQLFEFKKDLKAEFYDMSKSNSVVRGEPPPGVTAFVALQFVSESENRRLSQDVSKVNNAIREIYQMTLDRTAQYYKPDDERTLLILGKDNRWSAQEYKPESLAKPYSVQLQNSSSLPDSKALRTQYILDMGKQFPELFPREQLLEMMGLAQSEKFLDVGAAAARCAEAENEMILDGEKAPYPEEGEYHIVHWRIHIQALQDIGFKTKASPEVKQALKDHILATELLMLEQASESSAFAQKLNTECPEFPMLLKASPIADVDPRVMIEQMAKAQSMNQAGQPSASVQFPTKVQRPLPGDPAYQETKAPEQTGASQGIDPTMM